MDTKTEWTIRFIDERSKKKIQKVCQSSTLMEKKWEAFKNDVSSNPYFHPKRNRIKKLKTKSSFPENTWRYRNDPIRVAYFPKGETKTVYPLEVASATTASYKVKSKK